MRALLFSLLFLSLAGAAVCQPADDFDELNRAGGTQTVAGGASVAAAGPTNGAGLGGSLRGAGGQPIAVSSVHGQRLGFVCGRDNLGFPNLSGAMRLGGMAGNCYTMALVAKIFFEEARYVPSNKPDALKKGFSLPELAEHLGGAPRGRFTVADFGSLLDLSYEPGFGEDEAFEYMARLRGIERGKSAAKVDLRGRRMMIVQLVQLITTIHYLHYMQYQATNFLEAVMREKMAGSAQVQKLTKKELSGICGRLDAGKTCLLLLLNTKQVYGHVVLAYRAARTASGSTLIEVYDSNVQYAQETRPSVLEVGSDGRVSGYFRLQPDGTLQPDPIYDSDSWFSARDTLAVMDLPNVTLNRQNREALAKKTLAADAETAYLLAGGQFIKCLTEQSPETSSLRADTLQFLRNVQAIQGSLGRSAEEERLAPDASIRDLNRFLEKNADLGIRTAFPYALPKGMSLTDTRIRLDEKDPNRAELKTTLTFDKDSPIDKVVGALQHSAALSDYRQLSDWLAATRENVGPTRIRATLDLELRKAKQPANMPFTYGLTPRLRTSHLVLGDLEPSKSAGTAFQLEVAKPTLQGGLKTAMQRLGILGKNYEFEYVLAPAKYTPSIAGRQFQLTPELRRKGRVTLEGMDLDLVAPPAAGGGGKLRLIGSGSAFVAVNPVMADRGVSGRAAPVNIDLMIFRGDRMPASQWCLWAGVKGKLQFEDGLFNLLAGAVTKLADKLFPFVQTRVNTYLKDELSSRVKVVTPLELRNVSISTKQLSLDTNSAVFDLDALAKQLFSLDSPVVIKKFDVRADRLLLGADYR
jgi:hypothetical protein